MAKPQTTIGVRDSRAPYVPTATGKRAHPAVARLMSAMHDQNVTYELMSRRSGVSVSAMKRWRRGTPPDLANIEACLQVVGLELVVKRR